MRIRMDIFRITTIVSQTKLCQINVNAARIPYQTQILYCCNFLTMIVAENFNLMIKYSTIKILNAKTS